LYYAGSTDTVSYCTNGINDAVTSTLHIIVGKSAPRKFLTNSSNTKREQLLLGEQPVIVVYPRKVIGGGIPGWIPAKSIKGVKPWPKVSSLVFTL